MAHDVFISYTGLDKPTADAICAALEVAKVRCWVAPRDIVPGTNWSGSVVRAIGECRVMVLVFSSHSNGSLQVLREVDCAVGKGVVVVPFRIEDIRPSDDMGYYLNTPHWLDAMTPPLDAHLERLCETVQVLLPTLRDRGDTRVPADPPLRPQGVPENDRLPERPPAPTPPKLTGARRIRAVVTSAGKPRVLVALLVLVLAVGIGMYRWTSFTGGTSIASLFSWPQKAGLNTPPEPKPAGVPASGATSAPVAPARPVKFSPVELSKDQLLQIRRALRPLAEDVLAVVRDRKQTGIAIGDFNGPPEPDAIRGFDLSEMFRSILEELRPGAVRRRAPLVLRGRYDRVPQPNNSNRILLKVAAEVTDGDGQRIIEKSANLSLEAGSPSPPAEIAPVAETVK